MAYIAHTRGGNGPLSFLTGLSLFLFLSLLNVAAAAGDQYLIGVGKADITGPVVEVNFAGYADLSQIGTGLRQRLHARAFIIADKSNPDDRFVYIVTDSQSGDTAFRYGLLDGLAALGDEYSVYGQNNVAVAGTHAHSGPGAFFNYLLPQITSLGFSNQSYGALVDGCIEAVKRAHSNLTEGYLDVGSTKIDDGAINRSLWAYLQNPEEERAKYNETTDKTMTMLRFKRASDSKDVGVLTWFSVHGTSMYGNNTHAAADNKGVAAWLFEESVKGDDNVADGFVAGFSQASVGDTTPNVLGAWCDDGSGKMCTLKNSTCNGTNEACHGRGPEFAALDLGVKSCHEMGRRQYAGARSIYDSLATTSTPVTGTSVKSFHFFHDMRYWNFTLPNGTQAQTCPAALGYSFAAGTTDWPGAFDFTQNDTGKPDANPLWIAVRDLIKDPSPQQKACQYPKPVLLDVGELEEPYPWAPNIVDVMSMRVGNFFIIASPSEVTTMSGRRWRDAVSQEGGKFVDSPMVVLTSPANTYAHYVATPEEYVAQRYEGASTLFGQHELDAYINLTLDNMHYLQPDATTKPDQGVLPPNDVNVSLSFIPGVVTDNPPIGKHFGDVLVQPNASYAVGATVNVTFQGADPRNNLRLDQTYAAIEQQTASGGPWTQVKDDTDWFLVYTWRRTNVVLGYSEVDITWETYGNAQPGTYRVRYYGDSKALIGGKISAFNGTSNSFQLTSS